ncbi:MAG: plasmid pRiA4b ORF-3 family protein [Anaerolineae bacterium]|nr:plasmid pRiA4b ORF-3 family protein [Anaerolineae bacterium]
MLVVDEEVYKQWLTLNPTERYNSLLETWLLRGDVSILGECSRLWGLPDNLEHILSFIGRFPDNSLQIAGNRDAEESLRYFPGVHNLGLLDLFGLIAVRTGSSELGKGWPIERIDLTPIGSALLAVLYSELFNDFFSIYADEKIFGILEQKLQPYFPELKHTLTVPKAPFRDGTHIFKVSLGSVWRHIAIQGKRPLDVLASAILNSVDFDHDHLYTFSYRNRLGVTENVYHDYMEETPFTSEVRVGEVPLRIGQTMTFLFDFGDNWEFDVVLEAVDSNRVVQVAEVIETHGDPPEQYSYDDDW